MSSENPAGKSFPIPDPPPEKKELGLDFSSLINAVQEQEKNRLGTLEKENRRAHLDWHVRYWLKILLFVFVVGLNIWWDTRVAKWVWYSGYIGGGFHLSDTVIIALVSTSTANFLALILIVAKHLFPSSEK